MFGNAIANIMYGSIGPMLVQGLGNIRLIQQHYSFMAPHGAAIIGRASGQRGNIISGACRRLGVAAPRRALPKQ
jgi:hypothetical protein